VALQELPPGVECLGVDAQGEMAWPAGSMRRQLVALQRGFGQESEQDAGLANPKEDVTARLLAHDPQAQDRPVEGFRSLEVIDVYGSFDNGPDLHDGLRLFRPLPIQFTQLPRPQRQPEGHQKQKPHEQLEYAHELQ
jgi:hypothetical protein